MAAGDDAQLGPRQRRLEQRPGPVAEPEQLAQPRGRQRARRYLQTLTITLALSSTLALSIAITPALALTRLRPGAQRYLRVRRRIRSGKSHHLRRGAYRLRRAHLDPTRTLRRPPAAYQRAVGQLRGASSHRVTALLHRVAAASTCGDSLRHIGPRPPPPRANDAISYAHCCRCGLTTARGPSGTTIYRRRTDS